MLNGKADNRQGRGSRREEGKNFKGDKRMDKWKEMRKDKREILMTYHAEGERRKRDNEIKYGRKIGTEKLKLGKRIKGVGSALSLDS